MLILVTHQVPAVEKVIIIFTHVSVRLSWKKQARMLNQNTRQRYVGPGGALNSQNLCNFIF